MEENKEELSSQDVIDSNARESEPGSDQEDQAGAREASPSSAADSSGDSSAGESSEADAGNSEESKPDKEERSDGETSSTAEDESGTTETETDSSEDITTEEDISEEETTTLESADGLLASPDGRVVYFSDSDGSYPLYDSYEEFMASPLYVTRYENEVLNRLEFIQYALALLIALIFLLIFRRK